MKRYFTNIMWHFITAAFFEGYSKYYPHKKRNRNKMPPHVYEISYHRISPPVIIRLDNFIFENFIFETYAFIFP